MVSSLLATGVTGLNREMARAAVGFRHQDARLSKVTARARQEGTEFALKIGALKQAPAFAQVLTSGSCDRSSGSMQSFSGIFLRFRRR